MRKRSPRDGARALTRFAGGRQARSAGVLVGVIAAGSVVSGCGGFTARFGGTDYTVRSVDATAQLTPEFTLVAYRFDDRNTADLYLSTFSAEELRLSTPVSELSGHLVHVRMFVRPRPGRTPIDPTAFNGSVTHAVVAQGRVGIYRGGGFFLPTGDVGDDRFGGTLTGGTLRLAARSPGFLDALGPSTMSASAVARRDAGLSRLAADKLSQLMAGTELVEISRPATGAGNLQIDEDLAEPLPEGVDLPGPGEAVEGLPDAARPLPSRPSTAPPPR